jgi:hypothetical protein
MVVKDTKELISRKSVFYALECMRFASDAERRYASSMLEQIPIAQPDNRIAKIADLVEGTIDHFDLDDAMDLLYQIKEVIQCERNN